MLYIKKVLPKNAFAEALYVTEDNIKEFLEYAYPDLDMNTFEIDKSEFPYIYATAWYKDKTLGGEFFLLNRWYVGTGYKCWNYDEHFESHYDFVKE